MDGDDFFPSRAARAGFFLFLLALSAVTYAPIFERPFVQDDYSWLPHLKDASVGKELAKYFRPDHRYFYRPFSAIYQLTLCKTFGVDPLPWRVGAIFLLGLNAFLAALVLHRFTADRWVAGGAAVMTVAASGILMDAMLWMPGINELGSSCCALAAILFFFRDRHRSAAALMLSAMFFKEAAGYLPLLFLVLAIWKGNRSIRSLARFWPYAVATAVYAAIKLAGTMTTSLPEEHPYSLRTGAHIGASLLSYATWLLDGFSAHLAQVIVPPAAAAAVVVVLLLAARSIPLATWVVLALLPFLFFPNHIYRYYLIAALPAFSACGLAAFRRLAPAPLALAAVVALNAVAGSAYFHRRCAEGLDQRLGEGTNGLIFRSETARQVRSQLAELWPNPRDGAWIVLEGVDAWSFGFSQGVRLWYTNDTLRVCRTEDVRLEGRKLVIDTHTLARHMISPGAKRDEPIILDHHNMRVFVFQRTRLEDRTKKWLRDLEARAANVPQVN